MQCSMCGKEIDENSVFCKYCGTDINNTEQSAIIAKAYNANQRRKSIIILSCFFACILLCVIGIAIQNNIMSDTEKHAVSMVDNYRGKLKDFDSIKLWDDVVILNVFEEIENESTTKTEGHEYLYFTASGKNSFGASIKSTVLYYDGKYIGDLDEVNKMSVLDDNTIIALKGKLYYTKYLLDGENIVEQTKESKEWVYNCEIVDKKIVGRKLKIDYEK